jgi:hypothetical protein
MRSLIQIGLIVETRTSRSAMAVLSNRQPLKSQFLAKGTAINTLWGVLLCVLRWVTTNESGRIRPADELPPILFRLEVIHAFLPISVVPGRRVELG